MEKLLYTDHKISDGRVRSVKEAAAAALLSLGVCFCLGDLFELSGAFESPGTVLGGLIRLWNQAVQVLGSSDYVILQNLAGESNGSGLFVFIAFAAIAFAAFFLIKSRKKWTLLIFVIPVCLINIFFSLRISAFGIALLAAAALLYLSCMQWEGQGFWWQLLLAAAVVLISAAAMKLPGISGLLKKPQQVKAVSESVSESVKNLYYGENPLGSGDLTRSERMAGEETALKIRMSDPESLYLRGFVGEIYTGDSWDTLSTGTYYGSENLMYWLKELGFNTLGQLGQALELTTEEEKENHIQVDVENADRRYAYIPYEISELSVDKSRNWGGSFVTSRKFGRLSSYDYTAGENAVKVWTKTAAVMFTNAADKGRADEITSYLTFESYYNELVYKNDTYLSESDKELISEYLGPSGDQSKGHIEYKEAINRIKTYLNESFIYTEYPGPLNSSGGALESFLSSGKGSDVQYATAAVMMFRYYGIPARYVEGYLVTPEDVKGITSEDTIEIPQSRAHAWAEIYVDGIGFVPVEVCPEYEGIMEEADMTVGISNNTLIRPFEDTSDNSQNSQNELRDGGDDDRQPTDIYLILAVILIAAVIVFVLILLLRNFFGKLKKALKKRRLIIKAEPKTAVSAIYGYMEQEGYPVSEAIRALGNRAAYSRDEIREEDRKWMLEEYKRLKKERTKWDMHKKSSKQLQG